MSKPSFKGEPNPAVIAAIKIGGAYQIYVLGGIQAIGAMALGTEAIKPVDMIASPGNAFVAEGKHQPYGRVGIDFFAGPTETMLIADELVDAEIRATALLGQAKQGHNSPCVLVINSQSLARAALAKIDRLDGRRAPVTGHRLVSVLAARQRCRMPGGMSWWLRVASTRFVKPQWRFMPRTVQPKLCRSTSPISTQLPQRFQSARHLASS